MNLLGAILREDLLEFWDALSETSDLRAVGILGNTENEVKALFRKVSPFSKDLP